MNVVFGVLYAVAVTFGAACVLAVVADGRLGEWLDRWLWRD